MSSNVEALALHGASGSSLSFWYYIQLFQHPISISGLLRFKPRHNIVPIGWLPKPTLGVTYGSFGCLSHLHLIREKGPVDLTLST